MNPISNARVLAGCLASALLVAQTVPAAATTTTPAESSASPASSEVRKLQIANKPWTGDFDRMLERRMIRVYAPFSRSLYFQRQGP